MKRNLYLIAAISLAVISCKIINVSTLYNPEVNYGAYKTFSFYGWIGDNCILTDNDKQIIEQSFINEFKKKNIDYEEFGGDLILSVYALSDSINYIEKYKIRYGPDYKYRFRLGWYKGADSTLFKAKEYETGTIVCDVFSAHNKEIIWQAVRANTIINDTALHEENIKSCIAELVEKYPVKN